MLNIKQYPFFYLESTVIQNASSSSVCVGWSCLYHVKLKARLEKQSPNEHHLSCISGDNEASKTVSEYQ